MANTTEFLVSASGVKLSKRVCGPATDEPVVLIGGWPQTLHAWRHVQARLASAEIGSIAIDPPGLGQSDVLPSASDYQTADVGKRIASALAAAGIRRYVLVGHDVGAWIAYAWATVSPASISKLVLIDAAIPGAMAEGFPIASAEKTVQFYLNSVLELPELLTGGRERTYLKWLFESKSRVPGSITEQDIDIYMQCYGQPDRMTAGFNYYRAVPQSIKALANAAPLTMPVLAIGAEFGVGAAIGEAVSKRGAQVESQVVATSGHFIPEEAADDLTDRLLNFIRKPAA